MFFVSADESVRTGFFSLFLISVFDFGGLKFQEWRVGMSFTGSTPPHLHACPNSDHGFPLSYVMAFCDQ